MAAQTSSPPASPEQLPSTTKESPPLSIDLSSLPPLSTPSPPTNTLLITNLTDPSTFHPTTLSTLHALFHHPPTAVLNSFAPLPSLRRIIISYRNVSAAIATRQLLESCRLPTPVAETGLKVYFGEWTPLVRRSRKKGVDSDANSTAGGEDIADQDGEEMDGEIEDDSNRYLKAPSLGKLLFISPPPSPPCGWTVKEEDPPNKTTHAEDLSRALAWLNGGGAGGDDDDGELALQGQREDEEDGDIPTSTSTNPNRHPPKATHNPPAPTAPAGTHQNSEPTPTTAPTAAGTGSGIGMRKRGATLTVYNPRDHGDREDLPAVMVEDTTTRDGDADADGPIDTADAAGGGGTGGGRIMTHTARPPVELMQE